MTRNLVIYLTKHTYITYKKKKKSKIRVLPSRDELLSQPWLRRRETQNLSRERSLVPPAASSLRRRPCKEASERERERESIRECIRRRERRSRAWTPRPRIRTPWSETKRRRLRSTGLAPASTGAARPSSSSLLVVPTSARSRRLLNAATGKLTWTTTKTFSLSLYFFQTLSHSVF